MKFTWNQFSDFYFSSCGHFSEKIAPIFDDNSRKKNRRIFLLFFPLYLKHSAPFITTFLRWSFLRGGLHVRPWDTAQFFFQDCKKNFIPYFFYNNFKNKLSRNITISKKTHLRDKFKSCEGNSKKYWSNIKYKNRSK